MAGVSDNDKLLRALEALGGSAKKRTILKALVWSEDKYSRVISRLISDRKISVRQGGSIHLSQQLKYRREKHLYDPLRNAIDKNWGPDWQVDDLIVVVAASSGSSRMGRWSRPDLCAVSFKNYKFLGRKQIDLWTFEVKPIGEMRVDHVLEAVAYSRFSHRTYIMFHIENDSTIRDKNYIQCMTEADRHGIGFVTFKDPNRYNDWTWHREALHKEPNPGHLNDFMEGLPKTMQDQVLDWLR